MAWVPVANLQTWEEGLRATKKCRKELYLLAIKEATDFFETGNNPTGFSEEEVC